ncbi:hypothetical protein [Pseudomonas corrugata]|uniref:hypothetical protein n=1 Tax=Pseudomonas corrugata TaxID=47879 RepID=UPI000464BA29|nr:hypothetical protein [Pseudomonas corrugata]MDU9042722.1 hypothetical protein [Pseudomonas corrugata]SDV01170.1 hypothetical protein SAMN04490183_3076 [Pseudomonas corrugata]
MLEGISEGELPCEVFRKLIKLDPTIGNIRLSEIFHEEFIEVDSLALQLIWRWRGPGKAEGISDESLNSELLFMLKNAGYLM